jgi:drug/metabolite transporter (DMT)-like permease
MPFIPVRKGHLMALGATLLWGSSFIAMRVALSHATPHGLVWMRNLIGAAFLFALLGARRMPVVPQPGDRRMIVLMGLIFGVHLWMQAVALGTTSTMRAGWIIAVIPAVVAVGAWRFKGRQLAPMGWTGIAVASSGVLLLTAMRPAHLVHAGTGDLLMLASTITWAAYTLLGMGPLQRNGPLRVTAWVLLVSTLPNLALTIGSTPWATAPDAGALGALLFLGVGASGMALWLFAGAIASLGPERAAAFQYLQPFVTMAAAWALLHETLSTALLLAGPMVLAGVWLVQRGGKAARRS